MRCLDWFNMVCDLSSAVTGCTCISGSDKESSKCIHFTLVMYIITFAPKSDSIALLKDDNVESCGSLSTTDTTGFFGFQDYYLSLLSILHIIIIHYYYLFCRLSVYRTILNTLWLLNYTDCSNTTYIFILINFENFKEIF